MPGEIPTVNTSIARQTSSIDTAAQLAKGLGLVDWYQAKPTCQDTIVQKTVGQVLVVAGNSPQGAYWSAGDLLYRNGARFLHNAAQKLPRDPPAAVSGKGVHAREQPYLSRRASEVRRFLHKGHAAGADYAFPVQRQI